jgi:glycosyltransferase involved in cell wall biosynthesis
MRLTLTTLFFSDIPWTALYQRPQHLAVRFAARQTLLWVEPAVLGHPPRRRLVSIREGISGLVLPYFPYNARNFLLRAAARATGALAPAQAILDRVQVSMLAGAMGDMALPAGETVAYLQNFQAFRAIRSCRVGRILYDCIDNPFGFARFPRPVHTLWRETLDAADALIATSPTLADLLQRTSGRQAHVVSNGVEYARFASPVERPRDLPDDGVPIAGYVGSVYPWIDFALLEHLCRALPNVRVVIVGTEHPEVRPKLSALSRYPNFLFLGHRPYQTVPSYLQHFNAGLIPFLRNQLTAGVNPVKLYEYAAAGLTPVATDFSPDLALFSPLASICPTAEEFIAAVHSALSPDRLRTDALRAFARDNDWDAKAAQILALLNPASR